MNNITKYVGLVMANVMLICFVAKFSAQEDTLLLPMFEKQVEDIDKNLGTYPFQFDSLTFIRYQSSSLSDLLMEESSVHIRSNSPGNLATLSFRGLSGVHTFIDWNGINLNSPSAGLTDLSLINLGGFDHVSLNSDEQNGSRLSLNNNMSLHPFEIKAGGAYSSFDGYYGRTSFKYDLGDFSLKTHVNYEEKENDFPYRNESSVGPFIQSREHSRFEGINVHQDVVYKQSNRGIENYMEPIYGIQIIPENCLVQLRFYPLISNRMIDRLNWRLNRKCTMVHLHGPTH